MLSWFLGPYLPWPGFVNLVYTAGFTLLGVLFYLAWLPALHPLEQKSDALFTLGYWGVLAVNVIFGLIILPVWVIIMAVAVVWFVGGVFRKAFS